MEQETLLWISYFVFGFLTFISIRNYMVFIWRQKTIKAIYSYGIWQIENRKYNSKTNNYNNMIIPYFEHVFSFWLWGRMSGIKNEYKELLKPYFSES